MNVWSVLEHAREYFPKRPALLDGTTRRNYLQVHARAASLALGLRELGIEAGDRVAILDRNSAEFFESYFATAALGAILVPLNTRLAEPELAEILSDAAPRVWILRHASAHLALELAPDVPGLEHLLWIGATLETAVHLSSHPYDEFVAPARKGAPDFDPTPVAPDAVAQIYYTSGTTGRPKGVVLTHENVCEHALAATSELDLAEDDVWCHVAPMFHLADAWATFAITWVGGRHVISPRFDAQKVLELFVSEKVTITNLVPTMLTRLIQAARDKQLAGKLDAEVDLSHVRTMLSGGAPIARETVEAVLEVFGCEYAQTYGMTETSPYITLSTLLPHHHQLSPDEQITVRARTGRAFETVELEVVDESGAAVPSDDATVGEIRVRGVTVSPGYWNRPDETAAAFRDGWLYTGDLAVIDREGSVNIVDRKKDVILTGGETVYSIEVENVLHAHPAVLEAAVVGRPHPEWGEQVCATVATVATGATITSEQLEAHCREHLAGYKCPKRIEFVDELPKTGSGKIDKKLLRG